MPDGSSPIPAPFPSPSEETEQPSPLSVAVSVDGRIAEDKICRECGYNLRGLNTDGLCPECGSDVALSLQGHELLYASLPWLKTIARGFRNMRNALLIMLVIALFTILKQAILTLPVWRQAEYARIAVRWRMLLQSVADSTTLVAMAIAIPIAALGFIRATTVEPRVVFTGEGFSARRAARLFTFLSIILLALSRFGLYAFPPAPLGRLIETCLSTGLMIAALLAAEAFVRHAVLLLERTAETRILKEARSTMNLARAVLILTAVVLLAQIPPMLATSPTPSTRSMSQFIDILGSCGGCLKTLLGFGLLFVIWTTGTALKRIINVAENKPFPPMSDASNKSS